MRKIGSHMKKAGHGTILHVGWSKNGVHYVEVYGCFMNKMMEYKQKKTLR